MVIYPRRKFFHTIGACLTLAATGGGHSLLAMSNENERQKLRSILSAKEPIIWVFAGDSITQGAAHTGGMRSYPEIVAERVRWELRRLRDVIINTAVSGNTTEDVLTDFQWRIGQFKPGIVSLMLGTNDCVSSKMVPIETFQKNLKSLINRVRDMGAIPLLHTPPIIVLEKALERGAIESYVDAIRIIASSNQVLLIDHWKYWKKEMADRGSRSVFSEWLNDPVHPNGTGHQEIARLVFRELGVFDRDAATCGGPYYKGVVH